MTLSPHDAESGGKAKLAAAGCKVSSGKPDAVYCMSSCLSAAADCEGVVVTAACHRSLLQSSLEMGSVYRQIVATACSLEMSSMDQLGIMTMGYVHSDGMLMQQLWF